MNYYTIQNNGILISGKEENLKRFYDNIYPLPEDYEDGKYIASEGELILNPDWEAEKQKREKERKAQLSLTKREVFLALYKDKGITPDEIKAQITNPEVLIEFEYANDYFRGNPLIDLIGQNLGYTSGELDYLFEYKKLPEKEVINE